MTRNNIKITDFRPNSPPIYLFTAVIINGIHLCEQSLDFNQELVCVD